MDIDQLRQLLVKDGYADNAVTEKTAARLLSLTGKAAGMLAAWTSDGTAPHFGPIDGVDSDFLVSRLHMKAPALIIAYAMLEQNPEENAEYFRHLADNIIGFYPDRK